MKTNVKLFLAILPVLLAVAVVNPLLAFAGLFLVGNMLGTPRARLCVTLTVAEILTDVMDAFKTRVPALKYFSTDMSDARAKYGQQVIAHIASLPTAYDHNSVNGYKANAQSARTLLTDVPITINQWKDVPIKLLSADVSQDRSENYLKTISNAGYVLGKAVVDYALGLAVSDYFSRSTTEPIANTSLDTLEKVRADMNGVEAGEERYGIVNTAFFGALNADARVASGDYFGQKIEGSPYGRLVNIAGFREVLEYPKLPANGQNLSAFFFDPRAIAVATRLPMDSTDMAQKMGLPVGYQVEMVRDEQTGLSIVAFAWIDDNDHNIYITFSVMFGAVAGKQAGGTAAGQLTDYAGHRVVTAA